MSIADRWLLPDGVEEVLPPRAHVLESIRRKLLDLYISWGYEYVIPPMVEFLESLLTGTGRDLDLKTFKVTDQESGRMMGIRADITPQVARIDAHSLNRSGVVRLCYAGTVLHAKADNMLASRTPITVGAEMFGESDNAGDLEMVSLMIESLRTLGIDSIHAELGDVGIFRELIQSSNISADDEESLFDLIQKKAVPDLRVMLTQMDMPKAASEAILALPDLCGDQSVLAKARELFANYPGIVARLENMEEVARGVSTRFDQLDLYFDLSELRGYNYHTGIVCAAYLEGQRVAKGGRYDHVGEVFGRSRGATGFDIDIKTLSQYVAYAQGEDMRVLAPGAGDQDLDRWQKIRELRSQGYIVIESDSVAEECPYRLEKVSGEWRLRSTGEE